MNVKKKRPAFGRFMAVLASVLLMMTGVWAAASDAYAQDDDVTLKGPWTDQDGYVTYDCIWFGNYKQGTDAEKSPIKWRVLKVDGDDVFLSADKILDVRRFHDYESDRYGGGMPDVTWEDSTLRAWLNGDSSKYSEFADENFMDSAFTEDEQGAIKNTQMYSRGWFDNESCTTTDRVFILSREEVKNSEYGFINKEKKDDPARARGITEYAYSGGSSREGRISDTESYEEASKKWFYWLRNRGSGANEVMRVYAGYNSVTIDTHGWDGYNKRLGICPAIHISLSKAEGLWSYAGTVSTDSKKEPDEVEPDVPDDSSKNYIDEMTPVFHYSASDGTRHESTLGIYSDHMFYINDETVHYRNEFAQLSLAAVMAGYSDCRLDSRWTDTIKPTAGNGYGRAANIAEFYKKLKFSGMKFVNYEVPLSDSDDKVAFSIAKKYVNRGEDKTDTSKGEDTVIAVVLRGGGYGAEWSSNFNVVYGSGNDDHYGFSQAAEKVKRELDSYVKSLSSSENGIRGDLKIWICGYSRSAATANRVAHDINEKGAGGVSIAKKDLYAYTFATPNVATRENNDDTSKSRDENIFNIISPQDLVPQVPLNLWGYGRYGNTLWLPVDSTDKLWQRYTSLSGKTITSESPRIKPSQVSTVYKIKNLAGLINVNRGVFKGTLQEPLRDLFREKNQSYSGKSSDERYESLYSGSLELAGIRHVVSMAAGGFKNLGRVHEPEHYMARLDTMTTTQIEDLASGQGRTMIREVIIETTPTYEDMIYLDDVLEKVGASVEKTDSGISVVICGDEDTFSSSPGIRFSAATSSPVNITVRDMDAELNEKQTVSFSGLKLTVGKEYSLNIGTSAGSALLKADGETTLKPDYDSSVTPSKTAHSITVKGGTADAEKAYPGQLVTIYATDSDADNVFECWESGDGDSGYITDEYLPMTTVRMPDHDITVTGNYYERDYLIRYDEDSLWSDRSFDRSTFSVYTGISMDIKLDEDEYSLSFAQYTDDEDKAKFSSSLPEKPGEYYVRATIKSTGSKYTDAFIIRKATDLSNYELNIEDYWDDEVTPEDVTLRRTSSGIGKALNTSKYKIRYASYEDYENNDLELGGLKMQAQPPSKPGDYIAVAQPAASGYTGSNITGFAVLDHRDLMRYYCRNALFVSGKSHDLSLVRKKNGRYETLSEDAYNISFSSENDDGSSTAIKDFPTAAGSYIAEYTGKGQYKGETQNYFDVIPESYITDAVKWDDVSKACGFTMKSDSRQMVSFTAPDSGYYRIVINGRDIYAEDSDGSYVSCEGVLDQNYSCLDMSEYGYMKLEKGVRYYALMKSEADDEKTELVHLSMEKCTHSGVSHTANKRSMTCLRQGYTGDKICDICEGIISSGSVKGKTSHTYGSWETVSKATVFKKGKQQSLCTVCGDAKYRSTDKLKPTVKLNAKSIRLKKGQSTTKVKASGLARGDSIASWSSSNKKIVKVSSKGRITAGRKTGTATVTVRLKSGKKASLKVNVQKSAVAATGITVKSLSVSMKKGGTYRLRPVISPITCVQKVHYSSSNKKTATVSSSGTVKAKKKGSCRIKISCGKKVKYVRITVK